MRHDVFTETEALWRDILTGQSLFRFFRRQHLHIRELEDLLEENSREVLLQMFPEKSGEMNYFYSYCLNGCLGLVKTWLEDGEDKSPDYAADMTYRMVVSSVKAFYDKKEGREES